MCHQEAAQALRSLRQPGRLPGKRHISERPATVERRRTVGHWEKTITADNGTEFHSYKKIEQATRLKFYFATPHHAWERGTNENTNGLIRQYLPKRQSMARITQWDCNRIARKLNTRPRKRYDFVTPEEQLQGT